MMPVNEKAVHDIQKRLADMEEAVRKMDYWPIYSKVRDQVLSNAELQTDVHAPDKTEEDREHTRLFMSWVCASSFLDTYMTLRGDEDKAKIVMQNCFTLLLAVPVHFGIFTPWYTDMTPKWKQELSASVPSKSLVPPKKKGFWSWFSK